jgi:hypothetical protein
MSMCDPHPFVEPTWFQPVEFLDISPFSERPGGVECEPARHFVYIVREDRQA